MCSSFHSAWDRDLEPALEVEDGELVELHVPDASRHQIGEAAVAADLASVDFDLMNPVAGPVFVRGARPGDVLEVEVLEVRTRAWGWTAIVPFGSFPFPAPWLRISRIEDRRVLFGARFELPCRPFPGTHRRRPGEPWAALSHPPSRFGGNIDVRHPTAGATLFLPVGVDGALFSAGDGHAAQGDGEVCGSAIETGMEILLRLGVRRDIQIGAPQLLVPTVAPPVPGSVHITTGIGENLHEAARSAARAMIDLLSGRFGLAPEEAYALTSIAGDLRIHEIVNAPRWVVGMALPAAVLA